MARINEINQLWRNIREVDLRPIRAQAEQPVYLALASYDLEACRQLAASLRRDPARLDQESLTPVAILDLDREHPQGGYDLVLLLDTRGERASDVRRAAQDLFTAGDPVLVVVEPGGAQEVGANTENVWDGWPTASLCYGSITDPEFISDRLAPAILQILPDEKHLSLARSFPLFRLQVAQDLTLETSLSNAAYALSTGLAEVVPIFDLPLNVADIVVLTKAQAFLVYRLGLALGYSTLWRDYVAEFGGVLGGSFLWRQVARQLVGLIPVWGILPKVAVAYAGTFVVGQAVLRWYLTGRHLDRRQMRQLYRQAFAQGKQVASTLAERIPRFRLKRKRGTPALPSGSKPQLCRTCGRISAVDASYCQYCGQPFNLPDINTDPS